MCNSHKYVDMYKTGKQIFKGHVSHIMPILMTFFLFSFQTVLFCCLYLLSVLKKIYYHSKHSLCERFTVKWGKYKFQ